MISDVRQVDAGDYQCVVQNLVGLRASGPASLTVHVKPFITAAPRDVTVSPNGTAKLVCRAGGEPVPTIKWYKAGTVTSTRALGAVPLPPRALVTDDSLTIHPVIPADQGRYVCEAFNIAGSVTTSATVTVHAPPYFTVHPSDKSIGPNDSAVFHCQASGYPPPVVFWAVEGSQQLMFPRYRTERLSVAEDNTLTFTRGMSEHVICSAVSEAGANIATVELKVLSAEKIPPPPAIKGIITIKPRIMNVTQDSVTLSWTSIGTSTGYNVLYYCVHSKGEWMIAARDVSSSTVMITDLKPSTDYVFVVQAESQSGGASSTGISEAVRTLNMNARKVSLQQLNIARNSLSANVLLLKQLTAVSSTSARVTWQIMNAEEYVEGIYLRFQAFRDKAEDYELITVLNAGATSYTVTGLLKFTKYNFFLVPFYKTVEGRPSNSKVVQTLEDVPSASPKRLLVGWLNETTAFARWQPPAKEEINGHLLGYKIQVRTGKKVAASISVNSSTTLVTLRNASPHVTVSVCAVSGVGSGPFSPPATLGPPTSPPSAHPTTPDSTNTLLSLLLAASLIVSAITFLTTFYLKRRQTFSKELENCVNNIGDLSHLSLMGACKDSLWIEGGWVSLQAYQPQEINNSTSTANLTTFHSTKREEPTPYATTSIINNKESRGEIVPVSTRSSFAESKTLPTSESWMCPLPKTSTPCTTLPNNGTSNLFLTQVPSSCARSTSQIPRRSNSPPPPFRQPISVANNYEPLNNNATNRVSVGGLVGSDVLDVPQTSGHPGFHNATNCSISAPPPQYQVALPTESCQHTLKTSPPQQNASMCGCSVHYCQPDNRLTEKSYANIPVTEASTQFTHLPPDECSCPGSWDDSCSCSGSSCSYAQVKSSSLHL